MGQNKKPGHGLSTRGVPSADADRIAGDIVNKALARGAVPEPPTRGWDTSKGRKWVCVAFWGAETTVTFHRDEQEANEAFETARDQGADVFYAKTCRMRKNKD